MTRPGDAWALALTAGALGGSLFLVGRLVGFASPWVVLLASIECLGLLRVARPFVRPRLPERLRRVRAWELNGSLYTMLGVPAFGNLLRRTWLRHLNPHVYLRQREGGVDVCAEAEKAEAAHLWAIVLTAPYLLYAAVRGWWPSLFLLAAGHLAINVYPVLHLRVVRGRVQRILDRTHRRAAGSASPSLI